MSVLDICILATWYFVHLQYLDSEDSTKPIYLYVNCPGGSVIAGLAMFDTMQHIRSEVITINVGLAASMGSFILAAGAKVKDVIFLSTRSSPLVTMSCGERV